MTDEQLDFFGGAEPWQDAKPSEQAKKAAAAMDKRVKRDETEALNDKYVLRYMREFNQPLTAEECAARMEKLWPDLKPPAVRASFRRLKNDLLIRPNGTSDVHGDRRYVPTDTMDTMHHVD